MNNPQKRVFLLSAVVLLGSAFSGCAHLPDVAARPRAVNPDLASSPWAKKMGTVPSERVPERDGTVPIFLGAGRSKRVSSWDRTGGNGDARTVQPRETLTLADIQGPGMIAHIYFTMIHPHLLDYREAVLRMYWDGEETPSVEVPLGDFFCVGNCVVRRFTSQMVAVNLGGGADTYNNGFNCYWPMPFSKGARITIENDSPRVLGGQFGALWYHIDYIEYDKPVREPLGRFHAQWRRENPTTVSESLKKTIENQQPSVNTAGQDNYLLLEAEGKGQVVGLFLEVDNLNGGWYGEGDDMIFIDGAAWPPSLHGTGSEEIFGGGACPDKEYAGPYTGFLLVENRNGEVFKGLNAMYRWYLHDPLRFQERIRMTIEHGHNNDLANDYASVVYWYQHEPHARFPALPAPEQRWPNFGETFVRAHRASMELLELVVAYTQTLQAERRPRPKWLGDLGPLSSQGYEYMYTRQFEKAQEVYEKMLAAFKDEAAKESAAH